MRLIGCLFMFILFIVVISAFGSSVGAGITTIIIIGLLGGVLYYIADRVEKKGLRAGEDKREHLDHVLERLHSFNPSQKIYTPDNEMIFSYDENRKQINFTNSRYNTVYEFKDIIQSEIILNEVSVSKTDRGSQLGGALIGGVLLGGVGAAIGGLSGDIKIEGKVKKIQLKITVNDIQNPNYYVLFFDSMTEIDKNDPVVKEAVEQITKWNSVINIFIKRYNEEKVLENHILDQPSSHNSSIADELLKLSNLLKEEIITKEEFDKEKSKLLNN
ncbi:SHOCT domain-containing protein [Paenibacillus donghaensis]|uniref:SHOCT domain-containing protein n=1 Tax=Paenibacillus donghaensis TaxID=414771 RepID=A0A2Z2KNW7_9BACL|nr:SHOCT domain-containing protein [Paenibacillus donghaensis]ASA21841.1 hypothetical protein B9T62_14285 [Paenibacillus donghaensis]